ncbi:glutathione peroxidase [Aliarcobacter butzleri]|uniref:glutathione peroxidase n=1 Tax=Aliarcobacter butzleri TaxID=28197 RepID=UPI003AF48F8B
MNKKFYDIKAKNIRGEEISMSSYKDKVLLVVNTASKCGFTPQLEGLENLFKEYKDKGLNILGFPCNQFGNQEPGDEKSIQSGCMLNYGVSFDMYSKVDVNGENEHEIYTFLKNEKKGFLTKNIKWNFTKFLIGRDGSVIKRYAPTTKPEDIKKDIEELL